MAKVGKLGKLVRTMERVVEIAKTDAKFAERVRPMLQQLKGALDTLPMESLPRAMREPVERLKGKVDEFFQRTRRDVRTHEAMPGQVGGHTVEKHVGKSENWLRNRLENDPALRRKNFASSFRNEAAANRTQGQFVKQYREQIDEWLKSGEHRFEGEIVMNDPLGIVVVRGKIDAIETKRAWVTIVRDNSPQGWHINTSFPIVPTGRFNY